MAQRTMGAAEAGATATAVERRDTRRLRGVLAVAGAGLAFGVLAAIIRLGWAPAQSLDGSIARNLNGVVAPHPAVVRVLKFVTTLGSAGVLTWAIVVAIVVLAARRRLRLAAYLAVASLGALVLDPSLKALIGRIRPVVPNPVAFGGGNSFPSGHALDSAVCYGALTLVILPVLSPRGRRFLIAAVATLLALIGASRVLLGVHFVTDVIGGWCAAVAWLGLTVYAFDLHRTHLGKPVAQPLTEGIEPEAAPDLEPTRPTTPSERGRELRTAALLLVGLVFVLGLVVGLGQLVLHGGSNLLGDHTVPHWFAAHRTPAWTSASEFWSRVGDSHGILAVGLIAGAAALGVFRRWRPVVFLVVLMLGELAIFLAAAKITGRPRPDVPLLDGTLPTSAFPSGHVAATICLYAGIALLVVPASRHWWRWLAVVPAVVVPVLVALSRLYRGMHHPTDVLGGVLLAAAWTTTVYLVMRPHQARPQWRGAPSIGGWLYPASHGQSQSADTPAHKPRPHGHPTRAEGEEVGRLQP